MSELLLLGPKALNRRKNHRMTSSLRDFPGQYCFKRKRRKDCRDSWENPTDDVVTETFKAHSSENISSAKKYRNFPPSKILSTMFPSFSNRNEPCLNGNTAPKGKKILCRQKYVTITLKAYADNGNIVDEQFYYPSHCICELVQKKSS